MSQLTPHVVCYISTEEGLVPEAYKDGKGIWTWAIGVAESGGHNVQQYKDNPQALDTCFKASIALMETSYLPAVIKAFPSKVLTESQIAGALSFHWRSGAIGKAQWVKDFNAGNIEAARHDFMQWTDHGTQIPRCTRERDLFIDGHWPDLTRTPIYGVAKPSYKPVRPHTHDCLSLIQQIMGGQ